MVLDAHRGKSEIFRRDAEKGDATAFDPALRPEGEPVFPDEENKWWLTDVQQRKQPEEVPLADEDGPVSECDDQKDETEDEDPTSEEEFKARAKRCLVDEGGAPDQLAGLVIEMLSLRPEDRPAAREVVQRVLILER